MTRWWSCAGSVALLAVGANAAAVAGPDLRIQVECTTEHLCTVTLTDAADSSVAPVTTRFRADRLDVHGQWLPAEVDGELENVAPGVFLMEFHVVEENGVFRTAMPTDPEATLLVHHVTVALDGSGHVTFFHGVLHSPRDTKVLRSYLWGYPPGMMRRAE